VECGEKKKRSRGRAWYSAERTSSDRKGDEADGRNEVRVCGLGRQERERER
jgi:hypothetical protein